MTDALSHDLRGGRARAVGPGRVGAALREAAPSALIAIFLVSLVLPVLFNLGPMRLSPYRLILLVMFVPLCLRWISGQAGRIGTPDILMVLFCVWTGLSIGMVNGFGAQYQFIGISTAETLGAYLLARVLIRDLASFRYFVKTFAVIVVLLGVIALVESFTGRMPLSDLLRPIFQVHPEHRMDPRWGLYRAQGPFEHPILYGVFCSAAFALSIFVLGHGRRGTGWLFWPVGAVAATFASLSAGALLPIVLQVFMIVWDRVLNTLRHRWTLFFGLVVLAYVALSFLSNRPPVQIFIQYLTFSAHNAWIRLAIWEYGLDNVWANPLFGLGLNDWVRPGWLPASIDSFWLVIAIRSGVPGFLLIAGCFLAVMIGLARMRSASPAIRDARKGLLMVLAGLSFAISTVHLWNATYVFMIFLFASGVWMIDWQDPPEDGGGEDQDAGPARRTVLNDAGSATGGRRTVL